MLDVIVAGPHPCGAAVCTCVAEAWQPGCGVERSLGNGSGAAHSSVWTEKCRSVFGPKIVVIATPAASQPRAISTRPMRGRLLCAQAYLVVNNVSSREAHLPGRSDNAIAPIAEAIAIAVDRNRRLGDEPVRPDRLRNAGVMDTQRGQHRRRLRAFVDQFIAELYLHGLAPLEPEFGA
jgi:hypothetical protein